MFMGCPFLDFMKRGIEPLHKRLCRLAVNSIELVWGCQKGQTACRLVKRENRTFAQTTVSFGGEFD